MNEDNMNEPTIELWNTVDWNLDFESFEWLLHLAFAYNQHLPNSETWRFWPDWPADMIGDVLEESHEDWLSTLRALHFDENVSVKDNTITVIGQYNSQFTFEILSMGHEWFTVILPETVPAPIVERLWKECGEELVECSWIPPQRQERCLGWGNDSSLPRSIFTTILMLKDEYWIWDDATRYHWKRCECCGDSNIYDGARSSEISTPLIDWMCGFCKWQQDIITN